MTATPAPEALPEPAPRPPLGRRPAEIADACQRPEVQGRGQPVAFEAARRLGGACGPEADLMTIRGKELTA